MDFRPTRIPSAGQGPQPLVPAVVAGGFTKSLCRRPTPVLRRSRTAARPASFRPLSGSAEKCRVGGLRQGSLWWTATRAGVSWALHSSRGHLQSALASAPTGPGFLPVERLPRPTATEGDDRLCRRVHPALPATRTSARLSTHPLLRLSDQLPARRQAGVMPPATGDSLLRSAAPAR